ncbi:MAG: acetyl-CoA carboxylase biotin carboxyl carrier protein [Candidatus Omnitrophica bacterium]|nr:acetyl-CoA carboxylase biotin carboxyl carrier protein [Candidatus Omnitrophota bacterium]
MNIKKIRELVEIMNENDLTEVEIEQDGVKVKLAKKAHGAIEHSFAVPQYRKEETVSVESAPKAPTENGKEIKSPMVGTFYRAPSPEIDPYVEAGDVVQKGDVLCIVEAMKVMNEVKAECGGRITKICVENAEPVEFEQVMFLIEPV